MDRPLISVITACYQSAEFLGQCIRSVVSQDFDDFEYLIIDGGSRDGTVEVIESYADQLAYWHSKPDRGISHAFNQGLEKARGRWIVFLNADDCFVDSSVLSSMAEVLRNNETFDLIYGQVQIIARESEIRPLSQPVGDVWKWSSFRLRSTIPHPASFTNREFYAKYGGFDESFRNALDYEHYLRAGENLKVLFVPRLLSLMRSGGMSTADAYRSYRESRQAQIKNGTFSISVAWMVYLFFVMRIFLARLVVKG
jgi:glycosyltransferase involved in cell wall biosynthesis